MYLRILTLLALAVALLPSQSRSAKAKGTASAPILIEVFSDYQCPACRAFHEETMRAVIRDYANTGKVYVVHRDFPLPMHAYAREAASYAVAASRIGKFEQVADALFAKQDSWSKTGQPAEALAVLPPAEAQKVKALAKAPDVAAEVNADVKLAQENNVQQTPTMIITHKMRRYPVAGQVSYPIVKRFLDSLLSK